MGRAAAASATQAGLLRVDMADGHLAASESHSGPGGLSTHRIDDILACAAAGA